MKIILTLRELSDHGDWDRVCKTLGLDHYCMTWSNDITSYELTCDQIKQMGLSNYIILKLSDN